MPLRVGSRVVRGPDWKWGTQDKQSGNLGTVFEANSRDGWASVRWDHGHAANYRCGGAEGKHDLRLYDNAAAGVSHRHISCDGCKEENVAGVRWKCSQCFDYDLCNRCFHKGVHDRAHRFYRIEEDGSAWVLAASRSDRKHLSGIVPGALVARGADWKWGTQDGGPLAMLGLRVGGKVVSIQNWNDGRGSARFDAARVSWQSGGSNNYRLGSEGKVDLKVVKDVAPSDSEAIFYYPSLCACVGQQPQSHTCGNFSAGDAVKVACSSESDFRRIQTSTTGCSWTSSMSAIVDAVGRIRAFPSSSAAVVEVLGARQAFTISFRALEKLNVLQKGDHVRVISDRSKAIRSQEGHGGWVESMSRVLGSSGQITRVDADGDARVRFSSGENWTFSPSCLVLVSRGTVTESDDDPGDAVLRMLGTLLGVPDLGGSGGGSGGGGGGGGGSRSADQSFVKLYNAAVSGDVADAREALNAHPEVKHRTHGKICPLQAAAAKGNPGVVRALLEAGANVEQKDDDGDSPLMFAVMADETSCVRILLEHGANANTKNKKQRGPLLIAANHGYSQCARLLLKAGASPSARTDDGKFSLMSAVAADYVDIVDVLLEHGVDVYQTEESGANALHLACQKGHLSICRKLLRKERGLLTTKRKNGATPLHTAAINKHVDVAKLLVEEYKADIDPVETNGATPLLLVVHNGANEMIEFLVEAGANVNASDKDGNTPLHLALMKGGGNSGEVILRSALLAAIGISDGGRSGDDSSWVAIACYLALHGANLEKCNNSGKTPLAYLRDKSRAMDIMKCAQVYRDKQAPKRAITSSHDDGIRVRGSGDDGSIRVSGSGGGIRVTGGDGGGSDGGIRVSGSDPASNRPTEMQWNIPPVSEAAGAEPRSRPQPAPRTREPVSPTRGASARAGQPSVNSNATPYNYSASNLKTKGVTVDVSAVTSAATAAAARAAGSAPTTTGSSAASSDPASEILCVLCESPANVCGLPCTHITMCKECAGPAKKCLKCKAPFTEKKILETCQLCDDELATVSFTPCYHFALCIGCAKRATKCPECRVAVAEKWHNGTRL